MAFAAVALAVLGGCSGVGNMALPGLTKPIPFQPSPALDVADLPDFILIGWQVTVPETLKVSEANTIKPSGDIVWRGDPFGDRYAQVKAIMEASLAKAAPQVRGNLPITVQVVVRRFHALTERTRYTYGGLHELRYDLQVTNAETGEVIIPAYTVDATFRGYGGYQALDAERRGFSQKRRVTDHLFQSIVYQLTGRIVPIESDLTDLPQEDAVEPVGTSG